jgi:20S proteasome alpha/beta subunit
MHPARDFGFNEFSADGSLKQVNYASKAAENNNTVVGIVGKNCVVLVTKGRAVDPLAVSSSTSTFPLDEKIAAAFAGLSGDARPLVNGTQAKIAQKRFEFGEAPSLNTVANMLTERMQEATMHYGSRPFGVSILVGGTSDPEPKLIQIQTNGDTSTVKAGVVGKNAAEIQTFLENNYNVDTLETEEDAVKFGIKAILSTGSLTANEAEITVLRDNYKQYSKPEKQTAIENAI